ncbi:MULTISPECIES: hypothetical protein [Bacillus cereus group]|uniref:Uncharacterized protein n=1 Tax=Bacillus thuringiensis subsp. tolworthi TaxID=1442 RepID=A0A9W4AHT8_BACTO|nr:MULTISPECIES: hypothetical protein [Bacillus cereus group]MEB9436463.1 hypothetical protein [Bacillus cereus]MRB06478.1 hypothetical protein [Bacillus thuringiensis]MEB9483417.1 hypothetical protein [Bacillus cereus]MEB9595588.1 hypothetical protein [Bacillus cereus]MRC50743.1 hypothetical protein [Bacillus thuringiensis]
MLVIIFMLIGVIIAVIIFLKFLTVLIEKNKKFAIKIERLGYILFAVSLGWSIVFNMINDMGNDTDMYIINEKLNLLWSFHKSAANHTVIEDTSFSLAKKWSQIESGTQLFRKQEELVKGINSILFILSTLFIASGRGSGSEVIKEYNNEIKQNNKLRMRHIKKSRNKKVYLPKRILRKKFK